MQAVTAIVGSIAGYVVGPVGRWLCYSFQYGDNIQNLRNRVEELQGARERVQHDVDAALKNAEEIETDVNNWLEKVGEIIQKAEEVLENEDKGKLRFANGECLNLKQRHQLSRKAKKIVQGVDNDKILEKGKFDRVGYRPPSEGIMTSTSYLDFESRKSTRVDLMEALKDTNIHIIGVWGMGGIGKTTLVTEVSGQAKGEKLFADAAIVNVGQRPDISQIQEEIADKIHLKFDAASKAGRAEHLMKRLTKDTNTLIVLDDIWKPLDLKEIGIPRNGCKIVLVSRNREVLRQLDTEKDFGLETLSQEEAWNLVVKTVATSVEGSDFQETATKIVEKCAGLPIALVTVFRALKGKSLEEWQDALRRLGRPTRRNLREMQLKIHSCIELSYDHLENQEVKDFFLQCAQMPYPNLHEDLLRVCYGLDLFSGINTLKEARNNVCGLIRYLKDSGLLQDCSAMRYCPQRTEHYHMHDVVRDAGRLIALEDHNMIILRDGDAIKEWPSEDVLKRCKALSIDGRDIHKFLDKMEFPELELFYVGGFGSLQISDTLFQGMEKLRVLVFKMRQLSFLPSSIVLLTNLLTLKLEGCMLKDIAIIGKVKNLRILSLRGSRITELPIEIGLLTRLRILDLSNNYNLKVIPPNVLSCLVELEELYMRNTSIDWKVEGHNIERNCADLIELNHLPQLVFLEINVMNVNYLPNDLLFPKLERYNIIVGNVLSQFNEYQIPRSLALTNISSFQLETTFRNLLKRVESLILNKLKGVTSVTHELDREGFQHLKHFEIQNSPNIKYIIDLGMSIIAFPILETLCLKQMTNLQEICHGQLSSKCFNKLSVIEIHGCKKLKYFILLPIASGLSQLEKLVIRDCCNMAVVVVKEGKIEERHMVIFPKLRYLKLENLPMLQSFLSLQNSFAIDAREIILEGKLDCYMQILHGEVVFPMLDELILNKVGLKDKQHNQHQVKLSSQSRIMPITSRFENLSNLQIICLGNIKHIPSSTLKFMAQLKSLSIKGCKVLEGILLREDLGVQEEIILFPGLEQLSLKDLPVLERFCMGSNIKFPSLRKLKLDNCPRMKTFIGKSISSCMATSEKIIEMSLGDGSHALWEPFFSRAVAFPNLEEMEIYNMAELKIIWQNQFTKNSFWKVQRIRIVSCDNLTSIFQFNMLARFHNLRELFVDNCGSLEQVFDLQGPNVEERHAMVAIELEKLSLQCLPKLSNIWNKEPHPFFSFQNLQEVIVEECKSLRSVFPSSVTAYFKQLVRLTIDQCGVEEIFGGEEARQEILGQPSSKTFDEQRVIKIRGCNKLKYFTSLSIASGLSQLGRLVITDCSNMATIVLKTEDQIEEKSTTLFPQLSHLELKNLPTVKSFLSLQNSFASDARKIISKGKLDCYMQILLGEVVFPMLDALTLSKIGLENRQDNLLFAKLCFHPRIVPTTSRFENLFDLQIIGLGNIKHLLPSTLKFMVQLKRLLIEGCEVLEEIMLREDFEVQDEIILFPGLEQLSLKDLPVLERFCMGSNIKFPSLRKLKLDNCPRMKTFIGKSVSSCMAASEKSIEMSLGDGSHAFWEPFFSKAVAFPNLEEMKIYNMAELKIIWHNQFTKNSFWKVQRIRIVSCDNLTSIFQSNMLARFHNLRELFVDNCGSLEQVFDLQGPNVEERHAMVAIELKKLSLQRLPKLSNVWNKEPHPFFSFQNLQEVIVKECKSLRSVFPSSVTAYFKQLARLTIDRCGVEEIFGGEEARQEILGQPSSKTFDEQRVIKIRGCNKLKYFTSLSIASGLSQLGRLVITDCSNIATIVLKTEGQIEEKSTILFPLLSHLKLENLPMLKSFLSLQNLFATNAKEIILEGKLDCHMQILLGEVVFPMLDELTLNKIGWENKQDNLLFAKLCFHPRIVPTTSRFENLFDLQIIGLGNIKHLLSSTLKFMVQLKSLLIEGCEVLEEIMLREDFEVQDEIILFPGLEQLSLKDLPVLEKFCMGSNIKFPSLRKLKLDNCPRMKTFIGKSISSCMATSEKIIEMSLRDGSHAFLEPFFNKAVAFPNLEEMEIYNMAELKIIWQNQFTINSFWKVQRIQIVSCDNLTSIFQSNMLARFQNLGELFVNNCGSLEQVFDLQGLNVEERHAMVATELKKLSLQCLPKLRNVWNKGPHPFFSFQNLQEVIVVECKSLRSVFPSSVTAYFKQLARLTIDRCGVEEIFGGEEGRQEILGQPFLKTFDELRVIKITGCKKLKYFTSLSIASGLSQLGRLVITDCSNMTTIVLKTGGQIEEKSTTLFPQLCHMKLENLPMLKSFLSLQNSFATNAGEIISEGKLDCYMQILLGKVVFPKLNELILNKIGLEDKQHNQHQATLCCESRIVPTTSRFENLFDLQIIGLGKIKYHPSFTLKSLVQLKSLLIKRCEVLEEIILMEDFEVQDEIILFPRLKHLSLEDLPVLERFCMGSNIKFPSLRKLKLDNCPRMKTFIGKSVSSCKATSERIIEMNLRDDSHAFMEPFFSKAVAFPNLDEMEIRNMAELKIIWQNQSPINSFWKVKRIRIVSCDNLRSIFQSNMLARFQNLVILFVENCGSLEQVFDLQGLNVEERHAMVATKLKNLSLRCLPKLRNVWNKKPDPFFSFQNLQEVIVVQCVSLKNVFPSSVTTYFKQLAILVIDRCGVEEIVGEDEPVQAMDHLVFPHVKSLCLKELPRLERFQAAVHTSILPELETLRVEGCPFVCAPSWNKIAFEECQREICDKQVHFLFDKNQEELAEMTSDSEDWYWEDRAWVYSDWEDSDCEDSEEDEGSSKGKMNQRKNMGNV